MRPCPSGMRSTSPRAASWWASPGLVGAAILLALQGCGGAGHLVRPPALPARLAPPISAPDPAAPGPYAVTTWAYGSGDDEKRPDYGPSVRVRSERVDVSRLLDHLSRAERRAFERRWGFPVDRVPLNALVWFPEGEGPFPLVLVAHGNHDRAVRSETGYAYLGERLASRGYIVASVDQNFLNGLSEETDARAWLLLEHLRLWRAWNDDPQHPLHARVDMSRIALAGHSRGGEAAIVAASVNRLDRWPDDERLPHAHGFGIRAVIALSPPDGQYEPGGAPAAIEDVAYLTIHGGHDVDHASFWGLRAFHRARFTQDGPGFKAAIYVYRANHSRFNTAWGPRDLPPPFGWLINTAPLLDGEEQRRITLVYVGAFLDAALRDRLDHLPLFVDPRAAPQWLPDEWIVSQWHDASMRVLCGYEEDADVATGTSPDVRVRAEGFSMWAETDLRFRTSGKPPQGNRVAALRWERASRADPAPVYTIELPDEAARAWGISAHSSLLFSTGNAAGAVPDCHSSAADAPVDFTIELESRNGATASIPFSRVGAVFPPLAVRLAVHPFPERLVWPRTFDHLLQTWEVPMAALERVSPGFDPGSLQRVRFRFDRSDRGAMLLDHVALRPQAVAPPTPAITTNQPRETRSP